MGLHFSMVVTRVGDTPPGSHAKNLIYFCFVEECHMLCHLKEQNNFLISAGEGNKVCMWNVIYCIHRKAIRVLLHPDPPRQYQGSQLRPGMWHSRSSLSVPLLQISHIIKQFILFCYWNVPDSI